MLSRLLGGERMPIFSFLLIFFRSSAYFDWTIISAAAVRQRRHIARTHARTHARFPVPLHSFSLSSAPSIAVGRHGHWSSTRIQGWVDGGGMNHTDYPARQSAGVVYSGCPPRQFINRRLRASTGHHCSQAPAAAPSYRDSLPRQ